MHVFLSKNKACIEKGGLKMTVFLYEKKNKWNEVFQNELKRFADDYGLTLEEAAGIISKMAAQDIKKTATYELEIE